jgi:hypothetical protein
LGTAGPSTLTTLIRNASTSTEERVVLLSDPLSVGTGCEPDQAPADAAALAQGIQSDPDLEATPPMRTVVAGSPALRMDVVAADQASICDMEGLSQALTPSGLTDDSRHFGVGLPAGHRMRLYLLDLPDTSMARILAVAIVAPEATFDAVLEAASPILESFALHSRS